MSLHDVNQAERRERKEGNRLRGIGRLTEQQIPYVEKNDGMHLIVADRWDYWPTTGLWIDRTTKRGGRGISPLIAAIVRVVPGYAAERKPS